MKTSKVLLLLIYLSLIAAQILAQGIQTKTWRDGDPSFNSISNADSVKVDSVICLIPLSGYNQEPDSFQFILDGMDYSWPQDQIPILLAEDIDYRNFLGIDLYLVTDGNGNRVIEVDPSVPQIVWEFKGDIGTPQYLDRPVDAFGYRESGIGMVLITDQGKHRVIKVVRENKFILWQYGDETEGSGFNQLSSPADAVAIPEAGLILIADKGNNRVILVQESNKVITWSYGGGKLKIPVDVEYDGNTREVLVTDQGNHRVIKIDADADSVTWQFGTGQPDSLNRGLNLPTDADFLPNGNILICDQGNNRLIEVDKTRKIVWQFKKLLKSLKDADRLLNNKHLIISNNLPSRIGYVTQAFESEPRDLGREVSFDSLFWSADTLSGFTAIKLQLRSENTLGDLASAPWRGPSESVPYYTNPTSPINPAHIGHRFYEFRAILETNDPLYTPVFNDLKVTYKFYDTRTTGRIISQEIRDPDELIITKWKSIKFNTILPQNPRDRGKVEILINIIDPNTGQVLLPLSASQLSNANVVDLTDKTSLKKIQAIQLQAFLNTNSTSATPILNSWEVEWEAIKPTAAQINFVNADLGVTSHYQISESFQPGQPYIDRVTILLNDPNLIPIQDAVDLQINALLSKDSEQIKLGLQSDGSYLLKPSLPAIILKTGNPDNNDGFLQVFDRDTLTVTYTDPIMPTDQATAKVLIVANTIGTIQFENIYHTRIDSVSIGDTIFVRVIGEQDRNLSLKQDTVAVVVSDYETNDQQQLILAEVPDSSGRYTTGEFLSTMGLPLVRNTTQISNDSLLQTFEGSRIGLTYDNTIAETPILLVLGAIGPVGPRIYAGMLPFDFDVAPNPYYGDQHDVLRIRVASSVGDITVEKIEIYNLAGQKLREIDATKLTFYYNYPIPANVFGFADNWWNLKDQEGIAISSGTYFVKVFGKVLNTNNSLSLIKKLVVIR